MCIWIIFFHDIDDTTDDIFYASKKIQAGIEVTISDNIALVTSDMLFVIHECKLYLEQFLLHATVIFPGQIQGIQSCNGHCSVSSQCQKELE